MDIAKLKNVLA